MNGEVRQVTVVDRKAAVENVSRAKADPTDSSQVGAPMSGVLVELRVHEGSEVKKGDPLAVLSAMKMVSKTNPMNSRRTGGVLTGYAGNGHLGASQRQGGKPPGQGGRLCRWLGPGVQDHKELSGTEEYDTQEDGSDISSWIQYALCYVESKHGRPKFRTVPRRLSGRLRATVDGLMLQ
jgi:hypothetical protein